MLRALGAVLAVGLLPVAASGAGPDLADLTAATADSLRPGKAATLTIDQCVAIGLSTSRTIRIADLEIERVDYSRAETLGQLLPSVQFGASYNRMLAKQVAYMNMEGFGNLGGMGGGNDTDDTAAAASRSSGSSAEKGIKMGLDNSWQVGFSASMPLIAPQLWQSLALSDSRILRSVEQARQSRLELVNQIKSACYALLLAEDSRRVIAESYDMARLTHQIYSAQFEAGAASDYDVLRTSVAMKNIEPELMQAEVAIKRARLQLQILMGLDTQVEISVAGSLTDLSADMYQRVLSLNHDYTRNPSLALQDIDIAIADRTVKVQRAAYLPTLALTANYNWTSSSDGSPFRNFRWNPYSIVGVTLSVPLFEGTQRVQRVRQARVQANELRLQRETLENSIAMQVDLAIDNIAVNVKQIASCDESVKQAERAHDIMQQSFEVGAAAYLDLRDSELALTRSRLSYYQALYNYLVALSELDLLQGKPELSTVQ